MAPGSMLMGGRRLGYDLTYMYARSIPPQHIVKLSCLKEGNAECRSRVGSGLGSTKGPHAAMWSAQTCLAIQRRGLRFANWREGHSSNVVNHQCYIVQHRAELFTHLTPRQNGPPLSLTNPASSLPQASELATCDRSPQALCMSA